MSVVLDLIVILIIILCVVLSAKKGFVYAAVEVIGFVAAAAVALSFSAPLAEATYDKLIEPPIISAAERQNSESTSQAVNEVWDALPSFAASAAERAGITAEKLDEAVSEKLSSGVTAAVEAASGEVIRPVIVKLLSLVYSSAIMLLLFFAVKLIAKALNGLLSFSIIGKLNRTLGGLLGAVKGVIFAAVFCTVIVLAVSFTENGFLIFTAENIEKSFIFKSLANIFI